MFKCFNLKLSGNDYLNYENNNPNKNNESKLCINNALFKMYKIFLKRNIRYWCN